MKLNKTLKANIYQTTLDPYPWNTYYQLLADYGIINLHFSITIHRMYASSAVMAIVSCFDHRDSF